MNTITVESALRAVSEYGWVNQQIKSLINQAIVSHHPMNRMMILNMLIPVFRQSRDLTACEILANIIGLTAKNLQSN